MNYDVDDEDEQHYLKKNSRNLFHILEQIFQKREDHGGFLQQYTWNTGRRCDASGPVISAAGCIWEEYRSRSKRHHTWNRPYRYSLDAPQGDRPIGGQVPDDNQERKVHQYNNCTYYQWLEGFYL